jgi:hypothetical protein
MEKASSRPGIRLVYAISFAIGTMIGACVFALSGTSVQNTGSASMISYGVAGLTVLFSALSFTVVASPAPAGTSGFAYIRPEAGVGTASPIIIGSNPRIIAAAAWASILSCANASVTLSLTNGMLDIL